MTIRSLLANVAKSANHGKERTAEMSSAMAFEAVLIDVEEALAILDAARREVPSQGYQAVVPCRCVPDPPATEETP